MPAFLAPMLASAALSAGQGYMANRAAEQQQKRMEEQAAKDKLITSFGGNAQPQQMAPQQGPGIAQQALADPLTKQLMAQLIGKGVGALGNIGGNRIVSSGGGGSGAPGAGGFMNYMTP